MDKSLKDSLTLVAAITVSNYILSMFFDVDWNYILSTIYGFAFIWFIILFFYSVALILDKVLKWRRLKMKSKK